MYQQDTYELSEQAIALPSEKQSQALRPINGP
jgi:hypothetical protein